MRKAIVSTGCRKVLCEVCGDIQPGDITTLKDCYELVTEFVTIPTHAGLLRNHTVSVMPVDAEDDKVDLEAKVDNIRYFDQMKDKGAKYVELIEQFEDQLIQSRAENAGIQVARNVPKSPIIR